MPGAGGNNLARLDSTNLMDLWKRVPWPTCETCEPRRGPPGPPEEGEARQPGTRAGTKATNRLPASETSCAPLRSPPEPRKDGLWLKSVLSAKKNHFFTKQGAVWAQKLRTRKVLAIHTCASPAVQNPGKIKGFPWVWRTCLPKSCRFPSNSWICWTYYELLVLFLRNAQQCEDIFPRSQEMLRIKGKLPDVYRQNLDMCVLLPCVLEFASKKFTISAQLLEMCRQISDPYGKLSLFRIYRGILAKNLNLFEKIWKKFGAFLLLWGAGDYFLFLMLVCSLFLFL